MSSAPTVRAGRIELVWNSVTGYEIVVSGEWPNAMELAEMMAQLLLDARKEYHNGR